MLEKLIEKIAQLHGLHRKLNGQSTLYDFVN